jgi:Tol biopolymer transport system component
VEYRESEVFPDGRWLTFETDRRKILALPAAGGTPQELFRGHSHHWAPTGLRVYFADDEPTGGTRLLSADIHENSGTLSSAVSLLALLTGLIRDLAVSPDGRHILASDLQQSLNLTRLPLTPGGGGPAGPEEELSTSGQVRDGNPSVSPDGSRVVLFSTRLGVAELWMLDLESHRWERIQTTQKACSHGVSQPSWPDGRHVAFTCAVGDTYSAWLIALDGSATKELVSPRPTGALGNTPVQFSDDGRSFLITYLKDGFNQLFVVDFATRHERQLTTSRSDKFDGRWSPDDRWIVFPSNAGGPLQVWKVPSDGGREEPMTSGDERMRHVFYSLDPRWIYVQPDHLNIYRLPAEGGPLQPVTHFPESGLYLEEPTISPDGRFLYYCKSRGGSSLWLLTLGPQQITNH